jgi:hypothetical protein
VIRDFPMPLTLVGTCRWCGQGSGWHPQCRFEHQLHTSVAIQYAFLAARDGEHCWDCGAEGDLQVEHDMPLWLIAHLPPEQRRSYFGPTNLRLRCSRCHQRKTNGEASTRAKGNRLKAGPKSGRRKIPSRGFQKGHRPLRPSSAR